MYSSETDVISKQGVNLVEQILEQGQRLRNSMVKAILDNDPFSQECRTEESCEEKGDLTVEEKHKFLAYLRGEYMTRNEEKKVLDTFRAMSNVDIVDVTERSYRSDFTCGCDTCKEYYKHNLSCDFNHSKTILCSNREKYKVPLLNLNEVQRGDLRDVKYVRDCLKYVDSLKITVHSVILNQEGVKKVYGANVTRKIKFPLSASHTYFLEYKIPYVLSRNSKTKAKVDSGLGSGNFVRMCSKRLQGEAIIFKQISLHDIQNLDDVNLATIDIKFQVSSRTYKQKNTNILGSAKFNFNSFESRKTLSVNEDLLLMLNVDAPIVIGKVKVTVELGCGQSHFGEEFLKAMCSEEEKDLFETKHVNTEVFSEDNEVPELEEKVVMSERNKEKEEEMKIVKRPPSKRIEKTVVTPKVKKEETIKVDNNPPVANNNQVLFGFFCVTEAYYQEVSDTFVSCNPFCKYDTLYSHIIPDSQAPVYNFQQILPFVYDESFLNCLRDNFMVFEFWRKSDRDEIIGVAKVNLHQFYISYRNPVIAKYLERNKLPVIGCDWWEPIHDPLTGEVYGEVQILVALGTEIQIHNLKIERGFTNETVTAKCTREISKKQVKVVAKQKRKETNHDKVKEAKKVDIGTQSDNDKMNDNLPKDENLSSITSFLKNLVELNNRNYVENSTNTEMISNPPIAKTSDLLDTLQEALAVPKPKTSFKAHVFIENALHLPIRKKSKSKKSRGKSAKYEEILPNTYVSFETVPDDVRLTPVVQRNKNPVWNYNCDVELPLDLLTNNEKRLIFKVWKKCNTTTHPNMDTDTVIGFAGLDLTILTVGMPNVSGWFNILDFSSKCNGQIKITVTPQENVKRDNNNQKPEKGTCCDPAANAIETEDNLEEPSELLSRALKRKFTELDEITQRLRLRLSHVTIDESDVSNDEFADEFERDINTLCEEDVDMDDFNEIASNLQAVSEDEHNAENELAMPNEKSVDPLDRHLAESRLKLDTLFEKLALLTNNDATQVFGSRHISGCSVSQDQGDGGNFLFQKPSRDVSSESSSTVQSCLEARLAPDGAGNK